MALVVKVCGCRLVAATETPQACILELTLEAKDLPVEILRRHLHAETGRCAIADRLRGAGAVGGFAESSRRPVRQWGMENWPPSPTLMARRRHENP